jgi:hypothetical protein
MSEKIALLIAGAFFGSSLKAILPGRGWCNWLHTAWVKLRRTQCQQMSSGLPLKADVAQCSRHFAFVP